MSKIGKLPIAIPAGVTVTVAPGLVTVKGAKLINGHTKSCGCLCKDRTAKSNHERCIHCYING